MLHFALFAVSRQVNRRSEAYADEWRFHSVGERKRVPLERPNHPKPRFPLFVDLSESHAIIIGGGTVATRRGLMLLSFCDHVTIIAPNICKQLQIPELTLHYRSYTSGDCNGASLIVAATDCRQTNHTVFLEAQAKGVPVNVCDAPEECDFFFPAIVHCDPLVLGLTADGAHHTLVKDTAHMLREFLAKNSPNKEHSDEAT